MRQVVSLWVLCGLAVAGSALATPVAGHLTVTSLHLPAESTLVGHPTALLANGSASRVEGHVAHLHVIDLSTKWASYADAGLQVPNSRDQKEHNYTNARVVATPTEAIPLVGGYPEGSALVRIAGGATIEGRPPGATREAQDGANSTDPTYEQFYGVWSGPSLRSSAGGVVAIEKAWQLKLRGLHVTIDADEGHFEYDTGWAADTVATKTVRWLVLGSSDLTLRIVAG